MRIVIGLIALIFSMGTLANDLYVTQSGASLVLDVLQDGQNNTIGNSTTASSVIGASANLNIDQVGNSNVLKFDVNGASFTGTFSATGNSNDIDFNCDSAGTVSSCATVTASVTLVGNSNDIDIDIGETADATGGAVTITSAASDDSNVIAATVDGTSAILTITVDGDTNNWLLDIDGDGDINGHTYIHTHTGGIADVDVVQSGVYDNMVTLTTAGDNHNIDIIQRD
tara:strand:+ start:1264 stop:1944 length:681 start_codon:yes stop_codon:yes gene_type:complete